jgi:predicted N-acyltransferase
MGDRVLLVLARDGLTRRPVAGALNFFKGRALFGRYWGASKSGETCTSNSATTRR